MSLVSDDLETPSGITSKLCVLPIDSLDPLSRMVYSERFHTLPFFPSVSCVTVLFQSLIICLPQLYQQ